MSYQLVRFSRRVDISHKVVLPEAPYAGPGDVVGSALSWWGLRAYTLASVGANTVRLRRDSDNAESNFVTITGGKLDIASITSFKGAANLFVVTMFDQSGTGQDFSQSTAGSQPKFILNGSGSNPVVRIDTDGQHLRTVGAPIPTSPLQPYTFSGVVKRTGNFTTFRTFFAEGTDGQPQWGFAAATDTMKVQAGGSAVDVSGITDNVFHACQVVFNGASSDLNVDGTVNTINPGTHALNGAGDFLQNDIHLSALRVDFFEIGVWTSVFSSTQSTNMSTNQHTSWGF